MVQNVNDIFSIIFYYTLTTYDHQIYKPFYLSLSGLLCVLLTLCVQGNFLVFHPYIVIRHLCSSWYLCMHIQSIDPIVSLMENAHLIVYDSITYYTLILLYKQPIQWNYYLDSLRKLTVVGRKDNKKFYNLYLIFLYFYFIVISLDEHVDIY